MSLISVIGSGRSGTHWLGRVLGSAPGVRLYLESSEAWPLITKAASNSAVRASLMPRIIEVYQEMAAAKEVVVDKSHPTLWLVEELAVAVPDITFVGIQREVRGVVASTLKHYVGWAKRWDKYPFPNPFLGYTHQTKEWFESTGLLERIVARWYSHKLELERMQRRQDVLVISYEDACTQPEQNRAMLRDFTGLDIELLHPNTESLSKWETQLTGPQKARVQEAVQRCQDLMGPSSSDKNVRE